MFSLLFIILGIYGYKNIPVDRFPDIEFPFVVITTKYEGASPQVVDSNITKRIEDQLSTVSGIEAIISKSYTGLSQIVVIFNLDKDLDKAVEDVRDVVNRVSKFLPDDADTPVVQRINTSLAPIMAVLVYGDADYKTKAYYADKVIKREFERLNGVGTVHLGGFRDYVMWVRLDIKKLKQFGLTPQDVVRAIKRNHIQTPAGKIYSKDREYVIQIEGKFKDSNQINNLLIKDGVRLQDVGYATFDLDEKRSIVRFKAPNLHQSQEAIALIVYKQAKANTVQVSKEVKEKIKGLSPRLPEGVKIGINYDAAEFIIKSTKDAVREVVLGTIFTAIAVFLFLGSLRMTFIPFMAIPISILGTVFFMYLAGLSLNSISLMAMAVAVGLVIDDAIVVMESIYRRVEEGLPPLKAAEVGTKVVIFAILASTASLIAIFTPVLFMKSVIGKFFLSFTFTLVVAITISYIVSISFTPSASARLIKPSKKKNLFQRAYAKFERFFDKTLNWSLDHKPVVILVAIMVIGGGFYLGKFVKKEFIPLVDEGRFLVRFETPPGSSIQYTDEKAKQIEKILLKNPYILKYGMALGEGVVGRPEANGGMFFITLVPRDKRPHMKVVMNQLRKEFKNLKGVKAIVDLPMAVGAHMGRSADIQYVIKGQDLDRLVEIGKKIEEELLKRKHYVDVDTDIRISKPEVDVFIDRDKANQDGVSVEDISTAIKILYTKYSLGSYERGSESYNFYTKAKPEYLKTYENLKYIYVKDKSGQLVPLSNYVKLEPTAGYNVINRYNRQYGITIYANIVGISTGEAVKEVESIIKKYLPKGYTYEVAGTTKEFKRSFKYLCIALLIALVAVYMILASLFESLLHPIAIMLMLPFSIFGIFGAILITNTTLNIASFLGIILLIGLITRDSVLFVDRIIQLRKDLPIRKAILKAREERLRPILMTTFTIVASLLPVALGINVGSELRQPLAIAIIGGLVSALPLSLYLIPVIYEIVDKVDTKLKKLLFKEG